MPKLSPSQRKYLDLAAVHYAEQVEAAAPYLEARGISIEVARTFHLGCVVDPLPGDDDYVGRLSIAYMNMSGCVDLRFRAMTDGATPKYLGRPNAVTRMFNVNALTLDSPVVAVCEGELDTIVMHDPSMVGIPAVGVPGANNWKPHYRLLLEDVQQVVVMCDGDQAGRDFGKRVTAELENATAIHLPEGLDVNEAYLQHGASWLQDKVDVQW